MANTRDMRRRIKSIKNTAQITKAMEMVAASKMRKAQQTALAGRPYAELLNRMSASVARRVEADDHPLLTQRPVKKELLLVIATDKGLCGAMNTNLLREVHKTDADTVYVTAGRKGRQFIERSRRKLLADFEMKDHVKFLESRQVSKFLIEKFLSGEVDRVSVAYTNFVNTVIQHPVIQPILPISEMAKKLEASLGDEEGRQEAEEVRQDDVEYVFEPSADGVLSALLPQYVHFQVYHMFLESRASEHSSRMVAMKNATDNAKQLIKDLTLEYNKVRQASITNELLEITTAQMAMG
jgi:F-type H+-transporting ATPase subunit gamma